MHDEIAAQNMRDSTKTPLLTPTEERTLAEAMCAGRQAQAILEAGTGTYRPAEEERLKRQVKAGQQAREHLIMANTRLVIKFATKYVSNGVPFSDLIQEGNIGLITAVDKFELERGNRLSTYASWWIRQAIGRAVSQQARVIRLPVHMGDKIKRFFRIVHEMTQAHGGVKPSDEDVAEALGIEVEEVREFYQVSRYTASLDEMVDHEDRDSATMGDFIADDSPTPPVAAYSNIVAEQVRELVDRLTPREARIIQMRFGMGAYHPHTLEQVAVKFGLTRERIRQIEHQALQRLRHPCRSRPLRDFV